MDHRLRGPSLRRGRCGCKLSLLLLVGALSIEAPATVWAQGSQGADELFREGVRAMRGRRYNEAISLFRLSYELSPRAATMCNLAMAYERTSRYREALDSYRSCAAIDTEGRFRDHASERAREMERRLRPTPQPQPQPYVQPQPQPYVQPQPQPQPQPLPQRSRSLLGLGIAATVLGVGALGAGIWLNVWSNSVYEDVQDDYPSMQVPEGSSAHDRLQRGESGGSAALGLYIAGGILTAAGVAAIVVDLVLAYQESRRPARVALMPSRQGVSFSLSFSF